MNSRPFRRLALILVLAAFASVGHGLSLEYNISSLGLRVADLRIVRDKAARSVKVYVSSRTANSIFPKLNNQYRVVYDDQYRPLQYTRVVDQGKTQDNVSTTYDHASGLANASHTGPLGKYRYELLAGERDFFSTLILICDTAPGSGNYILDANGKPWKAALSYNGTGKLKTSLGTYSCREYQISLSPRSKEKVPYVDMVTHNLFKDKNKVSLWISTDGIPLKAVVKMGVLSMKWSITGIGK